MASKKLSKTISEGSVWVVHYEVKALQRTKYVVLNAESTALNASTLEAIDFLLWSTEDKNKVRIISVTYLGPCIN